jgi:hypothetical protein
MTNATLALTPKVEPTDAQFSELQKIIKLTYKLPQLGSPLGVRG